MSAKIENFDKILDFLTGVLKYPWGTPIHEKLYELNVKELQYHRVLSQIIEDIKITYKCYHRDFTTTQPDLISFDQQINYLKHQIEHVRQFGIGSFKRLFIPLSTVYLNNLKIEGEQIENKNFDYTVLRDPLNNRYYIDILRNQSAAYYTTAYKLNPEEVAAYLDDHNYIETIASKYR